MVRTDDGYLLGVFRIPRPGRPVVFLMHGLILASADYVTLGRRGGALREHLSPTGLPKGLPCLARALLPRAAALLEPLFPPHHSASAPRRRLRRVDGQRPRQHGVRRHETLHTDDIDFWDFSFHEIGVHDLPSSIDYVLAATNQSSLHYVGHSQVT